MITMSDYKLKSLTRRIEEKLAAGYDMVGKVFLESSGGKYRAKWVAVMKKG